MFIPLTMILPPQYLQNTLHYNLQSPAFCNAQAVQKLFCLYHFPDLRIELRFPLGILDIQLIQNHVYLNLREEPPVLGVTLHPEFYET